MAIIVEDGTGLNNADSMLSVADADTLLTNRNSPYWDAATTAQKEESLVASSDYLNQENRFSWKGTKLNYDQLQSWPRSGVTETHGHAVPSDEVPWRVEQAIVYIAERYLSGADLNPDLPISEIKRAKLDVLETEFFEPQSSFSVIQTVEGIVDPLLRSSNNAISLFTDSINTRESYFTWGQFDCET